MGDMMRRDYNVAGEGCGDPSARRTKILNLTQHRATSKQREAGVVDLGDEKREKLLKFLTFEELPTDTLIELRVYDITEIAANSGYHKAMIGGASFLMSPLEEALKKMGIKVLYAFSKRENVEETLPDGSVRKTQIFRHLGFVERGPK